MWCGDTGLGHHTEGQGEGQIRKAARTKKQEEELQVEQELRRMLWLESRTQPYGSLL